MPNYIQVSCWEVVLKSEALIPKTNVLMLIGQVSLSCSIVEALECSQSSCVILVASGWREIHVRAGNLVNLKPKSICSVCEKIK